MNTVPFAVYDGESRHSDTPQQYSPEQQLLENICPNPSISIILNEWFQSVLTIKWCFLSSQQLFPYHMLCV